MARKSTTVTLGASLCIHFSRRNSGIRHLHLLRTITRSFVRPLPQHARMSVAVHKPLSLSISVRCRYLQNSRVPFSSDCSTDFQADPSSALTAAAKRSRAARRRSRATSIRRRFFSFRYASRPPLFSTVASPWTPASDASQTMSPPMLERRLCSLLGRLCTLSSLNPGRYSG